MTASIRSCKSLFRATRAKPDRGAVLIDNLPESMRPQSPRREADFYPTGQPEAIRALLSRDGVRIRGLGSVWEPSCGDGALSREIAACGLPIVSSDLVDRGYPGAIIKSFYDFEESQAPAIITNPPYSEINARDGHGRWLKHTLDMPGWNYLALLLSWDWPAARANGLGQMLDSNPFSYCYLMRWKLDFTGEGSPPQRNAWFVWDRDDMRAEPGFRWMDRADARQGEMVI